MDKELQDVLERYKAKITAETEKGYKDKAADIIADIMATAGDKDENGQFKTPISLNLAKILVLQKLGLLDAEKATEFMMTLTSLNFKNN